MPVSTFPVAMKKIDGLIICGLFVPWQSGGSLHINEIDARQDESTPEQSLEVKLKAMYYYRPILEDNQQYLMEIVHSHIVAHQYSLLLM